MKTEAEAKEHICPIRDMRHGRTERCLGSLCMAWIWDNDGFAYDYLSQWQSVAFDKGPGITRQPSPGWEIAPPEYSYDHRHVRYAHRLPIRRTGHCSALVTRIADVEVTMS